MPSSPVTPFYRQQLRRVRRRRMLAEARKAMYCLLAMATIPLVVLFGFGLLLQLG